MAKNRYYAYKAGAKIGVVDSWAECEAAVKGIAGAKYKGFSTEKEARQWLERGADYSVKHVALEPGVYFDAGTGAGQGVEVSVANEKGENLLRDIYAADDLNERGFLLLPEGSTNNLGELTALKLAMEIAQKRGVKKVFGDSKLVIDFWSKWRVKKEGVAEPTRELAKQVSAMRKAFEEQGGSVERISGGQNPADLGFHR